MNKILSTEAAWLAGLFEGEGSCGVYKNRHSFAARLSIGQHTRSVDVLQRVVEICGCGKIYGPYATKDKREIMQYQLSKQNDIVKFIKAVYPYLLSRRKNQCDLVLDFIGENNFADSDSRSN